MMSRPLNLSTAVPTKRSAKSGSLTLPTQPSASPPAARISSSTSCAGSASRSLITTRAPSLASFRAIERPMPRPDPVTRATFPSSFFDMGFFRSGVECVSGKRDPGFAEDLHLPVLIGAVHFHAGATLAADVADFRDLAAAGDDISQMGDALEAHVDAAQTGLRRPVRQQAAQPGHAQHALGENVRQPGLA